LRSEVSWTWDYRDRLLFLPAFRVHQVKQH
jgi:hypothetical protein